MGRERRLWGATAPGFGSVAGGHKYLNVRGLGTGSLCPHGDVVVLTGAAVVAALGQRRLSPVEHSTK